MVVAGTIQEFVEQLCNCCTMVYLILFNIMQLDSVHFKRRNKRHWLCYQVDLSLFFYFVVAKLSCYRPMQALIVRYHVWLTEFIYLLYY